ncbi:MAG: PD-(D/E)XK nuclease family protein, partial [Bacillota bacterium]
IFSLITTISQLKSLKDFIAYFENIQLDILDDDIYTNNISQYFDALLELKTIEKMGILSSWSKFFPDKATGFFRLFLNYLKYKKLKPVNDEMEERRAVIKDLNNTAHQGIDSLIVLNANQGILPAQKSDDFLLTDKQRAELGLRTLEDNNLEEKYYFFRHLLSSKHSIIYTIENIEENISSSPFLEELKLHYSLHSNEVPIKTRNYPQIIRNIFATEKKYFTEKLSEDLIKKDKLMISPGDFKKNYSLSYYKYNVLDDCYYKFYLEHIARLGEERTVLEKELGARMLGIIVHDIFAVFLSQLNKSANFDFQSFNLENIIEESFKRYYLNINKYYARYYQRILLNAIKDSLIYFINLITQRLDGVSFTIKTEWVPEGREDNIVYEYSPGSEEMVDDKSLIKFYFNGRIDLLIETEEKTYIVDFKTGSGDLSQLDFYALLLNEIEDNYQIEKSIYNVLEQKLLPGKPGTELELKEKIIESLEVFLKGGEYSFEYKARCKSCIMSEICRVV